MEVENIIFAGIIFAVWLFIGIILYYTLSGPIDAILNGILTIGQNTNVDEITKDAINYHIPNYRWAIKLAFALGIATPFAWLIGWVFSREPFVGMRRI